jgi:transposase
MREAIVRAVAVEGHTADQVVELSAAGQLAGLPPFELARSTVYDLIGRARRAGELVPAEGESESTKATRRTAKATIARVNALGDQATGRDLAAMGQAERMLRELDRAKRPARILQPPTRPAGDDSVVARMQAEHDADVQRAVEQGPCLHGRGANPPYHCRVCREPNPHRPTAPTSA